MLKDSNDIASLSTEALGKLFPVEVAPYNENWKNIYK